MHAQLEAVALDALDDGACVLAAEAVRAHACDAREVEAELQPRSTVAHGRPRRELRALRGIIKTVRSGNGVAVEMPCMCCACDVRAASAARAQRVAAECVQA